MGSAGWARATVVATRMAQPASNALRDFAFKLTPPDLGMHGIDIAGGAQGNIWSARF